MPESPPITTQKAYEFYESSKLGRNPRFRQVPRFDYQNLPDTEQLSYELMTWDNFKNYLLLFDNDPHPFVMKDFKTLENLEMYAVNVLEWSRFSFKHGGCDWFLRLKKTGELVGVLHVYDLNWELINGKHFPCTIGYAIAKKYRRQGFATEATQHLLQQIPKIFHRYEAYAEPEVANEASRSLLEKLGFVEKRRMRDNESCLYYKKLVKRIRSKTTDELFEEREKYH